MNGQQMEVTLGRQDVMHRQIYIRNNGNRALGIDILHYHVPAVGFKVYEVYNDALKPHIKKGMLLNLLLDTMIMMIGMKRKLMQIVLKLIVGIYPLKIFI